VIFAGSDSLLSEAQYQSEPDIQMFPILAGSVVMIYNLPGVGSLTLSREVLASVFLGDITMWNDTAIQALNPSVTLLLPLTNPSFSSYRLCVEQETLPEQPISLVVRSDGSGTSEIVTGALSSFSQTWAQDHGTFTDLASWPTVFFFFFPFPFPFLSFPFLCPLISVYTPTSIPSPENVDPEWLQLLGPICTPWDTLIKELLN